MIDQFCQSILSAIKKTLPANLKQINLHEPVFCGNEWKYVKECIDTTMVSSVGKYVDQFEQMLSEYTGIKKAVAVVNGTSALHICLKLAGVLDDDEVLIPDLTFVATANAVSYCNAIPHFIDIEEKTLGVSHSKLNDYLKEIAIVKDSQCFNKITQRRIKAIVPMHTFGHPVDIEPLLEISQSYHIDLIEDAAESLGSFYKNKHTGHWGKLTALSFNGNKTITTGGGGAILTNDFELGKLAKHITTTARIFDKWNFIHDQIGYNYRMPNINAALGCAQLENLTSFIDSKRALAERYYQAFKNLKGVRFFMEPQFAKSNYWLNTILLDQDYSQYKEKILELTNKNGIMTRPAWTLMHKLPMFSICPKMDTTIAENIEARLINIPSSSFL